MDTKQIVNELVTNGGANYMKDLRVKSVTITEMDSYVRVGLNVDKPIPAMVTNDNGITYEEGESNVLFASTFSIGGILRDNEDAAFAVNHIIENPKSLQILLSKAKLDIVQEKVAAGTEYRNPFVSSSDATVFDSDKIITHIVAIKLTDRAIEKLDKIGDAMLGI